MAQVAVPKLCVRCAGTDPEDTIRNAFAMFDDEGKGFLPEE